VLGEACGPNVALVCSSKGESCETAGSPSRIRTSDEPANSKAPLPFGMALVAGGESAGARAARAGVHLPYAGAGRITAQSILAQN
jgi:hypothetical protein